MQFSLAFLLILYLITEAADQILHMLNIKHLCRHGNEVPPGFEEHMDRGTLLKMRDYTVARDRVDRVEALVFTAATLVFLFGPGLNWFNNFLDAWDWPPVIAGVIFFMVLVYGETLINVPFSLYNTFSLEKRFGFTTQTFQLWFKDLCKSLAVNTLLLGVIFYVILWLIMALPGMWWLAGWIFVLLFSVFLLYISPYVIEPLFNKFTPLEDSELVARIREMMTRVGLKIERVFIMDASKRSKHSNAYFTGIGHVKRIVLFDTLLGNHEDDEILAILAHEAGHWKKKHLLKMLLISQAVTLVGFYLAYRLTTANFLVGIFGLDTPSMHAKLLLVVFIGSLVLFPLKPFMTYLSRHHEIEADSFALALTKRPKAMAEALIKLGKDNLANMHPHPWYVAVYYSHPPLVQRVKRILAAGERTIG